MMLGSMVSAVLQPLHREPLASHKLTHIHLLLLHCLSGCRFVSVKSSVPRLCYCLQVMRRVSGAEKFSGKNQYALRVSPGIDCAFMVALCITVDELFND